MADIIGVIAVCVKCEEHPRPPARDKEGSKFQEARNGKILGQAMGQLFDHDNEDEIEK